MTKGSYYQYGRSLASKMEELYSDHDSTGYTHEVEDVIQMRKSEWKENFLKFTETYSGSDFSKRWAELGASNLNDDQTKAFYYALKHFVSCFDEPFDRSSMGDFDLELDIKELHKEFDSLVQKGFLVSVGEGYVISPKVSEVIFHGHDEIVSYKNISHLSQIIKHRDIEKKILYYSAECQEDLDNLRTVLSKDGFEYACTVLKNKKRNPSIISLLWGGPGTGKTESVKQFALESGRDIFLFDVAKVTASDWGATENLYRDLFRAYSYVAAVMSNTPILLFNEADQVLSRRLLSIERSIDKSENIVSDILLQEFEDLHGIVLATTNHIDILDEAFDRRFLFKIELNKPDARARKSIWMSVIPELSEQEADYLADKFEMSGAQISNVATKRDIAQVYYRGDMGLSYIEGLCQKEMSAGKKIPVSRRIGF